MRNKADWLLVAGLLALCVFPAAGSVARLAELWGGADITPENARFFADPVPVVVHILTANVYSILGAFQFASAFRRRRPDWHRRAGRVLTVCGLAAALSGLWMTQFYPYAEGDGDLLYVFRLVFGVAMTVCIVMGFAAIRRRDFANHRAWMIRGYAIGLGAGTQAVIHIPWLLLGGGLPHGLVRALLLGAGWAINVVIAEWSIRRQARPAVQPAATAT